MPHGAITRAESEQPPVTGSGILISLRTPTDCHHHRQASSYPYGLPEVAPLSSSSLIFSPREQTADCHQALKQVLTTPCVVCYAWHQALHILAGSHRLEASLVPGTHMGRHSVGPGIYGLYSPSPAHPSHVHTQPSSMSCPRNTENILGQAMETSGSK